MKKDYFANKADSYDQSTQRVDNVSNIANLIASTVCLEKSMHIMDFGSGTGLLLERIAPHVGRVTAVDLSPSMNRQLEQKREALPCELDVLEIDLATAAIDHRFDGIISSMTMHHVKDIERMFRRFHQVVKPGGFIAIADLDKEDGSFHEEDTGVFHHGFDREAMGWAAEAAGFSNVGVATASVIEKRQAHYPVFLLTAWRQA